MFSCPTTPETQRPRLKPSKSTGWSWPRLVTVPEAQRATAARTRGASVPNEDKAPNAMNQKTSSLPPIEDSDVAGSTGRSAPISPIETQGGHFSAASGPSQPVDGEQLCSISSINNLQGTRAQSSNARQVTDGKRTLEPLYAEGPAIAEVDKQSSVDVELAEPAITEFEPKIEQPEVPGKPEKRQALPAIPIIKIQRPSMSSDHLGMSPGVPAMPPTIDSILADEPQKTSERAVSQRSNMMPILPQPTDALPNNSVAPVRIRRRKIALCKTRNVIARKTILKMGLGRRLAIPTKEALRRMAKGEDVTVADFSVVS